MTIEQSPRSDGPPEADRFLLDFGTLAPPQDYAVINGEPHPLRDAYDLSPYEMARMERARQRIQRLFGAEARDSAEDVVEAEVKAATAELDWMVSTLLPTTLTTRLTWAPRPSLANPHPEPRDTVLLASMTLQQKLSVTSLFTSPSVVDSVVSAATAMLREIRRTSAGSPPTSTPSTAQPQAAEGTG